MEILYFHEIECSGNNAPWWIIIVRSVLARNSDLNIKISLAEGLGKHVSKRDNRGIFVLVDSLIYISDWWTEKFSFHYECRSKTTVVSCKGILEVARSCVGLQWWSCWICDDKLLVPTFELNSSSSHSFCLSGYWGYSWGLLIV